jgi:hypothetical protein
MESWSQSNVLPIIFRLIAEAFTRQSGFAPSPEIVKLMLSDPEGREAVDWACKGGRDKTPEWVAQNMVAWFGQRITIGTSDWADRVDRVKIHGRWAYKPHG